MWNKHFTDWTISPNLVRTHFLRFSLYSRLLTSVLGMFWFIWMREEAFVTPFLRLSFCQWGNPWWALGWNWLPEEPPCSLSLGTVSFTLHLLLKKRGWRLGTTMVKHLFIHSILWDCMKTPVGLVGELLVGESMQVLWRWGPERPSC